MTHGLTEEKVLPKVQSTFSPVLGHGPEILQTMHMTRTQRDQRPDFVEASSFHQPTGHNPFMTVGDDREFEHDISGVSL